MRGFGRLTAWESPIRATAAGTHLLPAFFTILGGLRRRWGGRAVAEGESLRLQAWAYGGGAWLGRGSREASGGGGGGSDGMERVQANRYRTKPN